LGCASLGFGVLEVRGKFGVFGGVVLFNEGQQFGEGVVALAVVNEGLHLERKAHAGGKGLIDLAKVVVAEDGKFLIAEGRQQQPANGGGIVGRLGLVIVPLLTFTLVSL
jgi:hypothetical protein